MFGGPGAWDNAQKGQVQCPREGCDGDEAAFFQVQIRSADEPMTSFYKVSGSLKGYGAPGSVCRLANFCLSDSACLVDTDGGRTERTGIYGYVLS